ncbi:hypothetical protein [Blautia obeum]|uniref:hypothetical protein n=1 Tax=Blautia obeum TaxID=40520 RepID=UPI002A8CAADB|nr:hypothetical protein [Lachnospiraceae bacterium]MDY4206250.1 hypothetical protein [Lachnospiraceae bacterium]
MDMIYVFRGRIQELYAKNSKVFDKIFQFILAIVTFTVINHNVGFMKAAASPVASLALAVICTFLPLMVTVIMATVLILAHMFALSIGMLAVTAVIFLIMYIFYLRLTPKKALIVLLTPLAFFLKVPYIIPVACGLVATPISLIAISCGTIVYYMLEYVKKSSVNIENVGAKGMLTQATKYVQQVFQNKEMWIIIVAFIICFFVVFTLRRTSMDHAWKVAIVAGAVVNVIVIVAGDIALGVHTSYGTLIGGNIGAIIIGLILELFLFSVDYARSENLQFEDDEYYYYVKAIPKVSVATPEKTVKRINERQETEIIDTETVRKKADSQAQNRKVNVKKSGKKPAPKKGPAAKKHDMKEVDKMLLTQSLRKDLNLKD